MKRRSIENFYWLWLHCVPHVRGIDKVSFLFVLLHDELPDRLIVFRVERDPGLEVVQAEPDFSVVSVA